MKRSFVASAVAFSLVACSAAPEAPKRKTTVSESDAGSKETAEEKDLKPVDPKKIALNFELSKVSQDAGEYTFGVAEFLPKNFAGESLKISRHYKVSSPDTLKDEQKQGLAALCRDIGLSAKPGSLDEPSENNDVDDPAYVVWRSHYSQAQKTLLDELLRGGQKDILCVLKIELENNSEALPFYQVFDPVPADAKKAAGAADIEAAMDAGLMLALNLGGINVNEDQLREVQESSSPKFAVKALKAEDIKLVADMNATPSSCLLDPNKQTDNIMNPTQLLTSKMTVDNKVEVELGTLTPVPLDGRILKSCEQVKSMIAAKSVETSLDCKTYNAIKLEGAEAGCQWDVDAVNPADKENSLPLRVSLSKVPFKLFDIKKVDDALTAIAQSAKNPVRTKAINFQSFSANALKSMEQMFDLWIAVEPKSYEADLVPTIRTIRYEPCSAGILGYAQLRSSTFTICGNASLTENALQKGNDPLRPIIQLITTAHEVRHAIRWQHDFDNTSYKACDEGTAVSAVTMHAVIKTCQEAYCLVLKNMAVREYINELNYSYKKDPRKFQGQCKIWNEELMLTERLSR